MFRTLVIKELKVYFTSPKFLFTFIACSVLIILSVSIGVQDYQGDLKRYQTARQLERQMLEERTSWAFLGTRAFIVPDPMQILSSGITNDIGRFSPVSATDAVGLRSSAYSNDPIFAVFRLLDLNFIFLAVLSLFAILFTYDSVNGEREAGTLRLTFSNPVPRVKYIVAKFAGAWLGLVIPLLIPLLVSALIIVLTGVPLADGRAVRLVLFLGVSLVYFSFFIGLGLLVSSLTRRSSVSFLVLLVAWVSLTLIIPRIGVMAAGKIIAVPSAAEVNARIDTFSKDRWKSYTDDLIRLGRERRDLMAGMTEAEKEAFRDDNEWTWMEENDRLRKAVQSDIKDFTRRVQEDHLNREAQRERLAFRLTRISPASAYQLSAMNIAGTDTGLKSRYQQAIEDYRETFLQYTERKDRESGGGMGGININFDTEKGLSVQTPRDRKTIDIVDMPLFQPPLRSGREVLSDTLTDLALLVLYAAAVLGGAFVAFLRYDVR
ncbi:MAG: ABC transporter permease subunit [Candidatus Krumholzibacteriota bacterium]|nr:ABC transporter permease subunit [Candidatus Krumholzibacteriota bacterium]